MTKIVLPSGAVLTFDHHGRLETDAAGAAVIRALPIFGRFIHQLDESTPAPPPKASERQTGISDTGVSTAPTRSALGASGAAPLSLTPGCVPAPPTLFPAVQRGIEFLHDAIPAGYARPARDVIMAAAARGIRGWALQEAKRQVGARSVKAGMRKGWLWVRPGGENS